MPKRPPDPALGLDGDNFYLYGHSWGGMLGIEYALKYQRHLKGLVLSNTVASVPKQTAHVENELMPEMDPDVLAEIEQLEEEGAYGSPQYEQLLLEHYYIRRFLRMPFEEWPEPVLRTLKHFNKKIYAALQGPSVLRVVSGTMVDWDRTGDLAGITVPTLVIGAERDTMDPDHMRWMASELPSGRYHHCPDGSHLALYDDQQVYFDGLIEFIAEVNRRAV